MGDILVTITNLNSSIMCRTERIHQRSSVAFPIGTIQLKLTTVIQGSEFGMSVWISMEVDMKHSTDEWPKNPKERLDTLRIVIHTRTDILVRGTVTTW